MSAFGTERTGSDKSKSSGIKIVTLSFIYPLAFLDIRINLLLIRV